MKYTIYIIDDTYAEDARYYEELDYFKEQEDYSREVFQTVAEADAYVSALYRGMDERSPAGFAVLRSWYKEDEPYINALLTEE